MPRLKHHPQKPELTSPPEAFLGFEIMAIQDIIA